jgi:hypothetical protein
MKMESGQRVGDSRRSLKNEMNPIEVGWKGREKILLSKAILVN